MSNLYACIRCGRKDQPLHVNYRCPRCQFPLPGDSIRLTTVNAPTGIRAEHECTVIASCEMTDETAMLLVLTPHDRSAPGYYWLVEYDLIRLELTSVTPYENIVPAARAYQDESGAWAGG